jgi:hypothetical protein
MRTPQHFRPKVKELFELLEDVYHVPDTAFVALVEAFRWAVVRVVDDVVSGRQQQAIVGYYVLRQLDGDTWWQR